MKEHAHTPSDSAHIPAVSTQRTDGARFFECDDDDEVTYTIVAIDLDHAKNVIRKAGIEFGSPSQPLDRAVGLTWRELSKERVARMLRCHTDDERGVIPLAQARIGEWFCSEW